MKILLLNISNISNSTQANHLLREERIRHNWRQRDLAEQLGTTVLTIKRWERGYQQPSSYFRFKLCTLFNKRAEELGLVEVVSSSPLTRKDISTTKPTSISPSEPLEIWMVPYVRNLHFTGRDDLLEQLGRFSRWRTLVR